MNNFISRRDKEEVRGPASTPAKTQPWYKKRPVIIAAVVASIVLVIAITIIIMLQVAANNTNAKMHEAKERTGQQLQSLQSEYNNASPQDRLNKFHQFAESIEVVSCDRAGALPWLAGSKQRCQAFAEVSEELQNEATQVTNLLEYDIYVKEKISPVVQTEKEVTDYNAELKKWQTLVSALKEAPQKELLKDVHSKLVKVAEGVVSGWQAVVKADKEKKADEFNKARDELTEKYEAFKAENSKLTDVYKQAQQQLTDTYDAYQNAL